MYKQVEIYFVYVYYSKGKKRVIIIGFPFRIQQVNSVTEKRISPGIGRCSCSLNYVGGTMDWTVLIPK